MALTAGMIVAVIKRGCSCGEKVRVNESNETHEPGILLVAPLSLMGVRRYREQETYINFGTTTANHRWPHYALTDYGVELGRFNIA